MGGVGFWPGPAPFFLGGRVFIRPTAKRGDPDPISDVIGDVRYATPYYPPGLTEATLGPRSRFPVGFSRYYLLHVPPIAVDFEPSPLDSVSTMHCEAKRKWCHEHGVVYVPIFLRERLTGIQFAERLRVEEQALEEAQRIQAVGQALDDTTTPEVGDETFHRMVDQEALARLGVEEKYQRMSKTSRIQRLKRIRKVVEAEFLKRQQDGSLGRYVSYHKSPVPVG